MRPWNPPSFDDEVCPGSTVGMGLPTVAELESIRSGVHKNAREEGREVGYAKGVAGGFAAGFDQGRQEGREAAYSESAARVAELTDALQSALQILRDIEVSLGPDLTELAFEIAKRLAGRESMERGPFMAAVQEALMRLPRPGETLFVRLAPDSVELWQTMLQDPGLPFNCQVQLDPSVGAGHAFVDVDGTRINVGALARQALLRMALGLPQIDVL